MSSYVKVTSALPTTAALVCSLFLLVDEMPNINIAQLPTINQTQEPAAFGSAQTQYAMTDENFESLQNINTLHNFASNLLENIEDLNPEFSKVIDENYWDLI